VRTLDGFVDRDEGEWPLARTAWTRLYLDPEGTRLTAKPGGSERAVSFDALGDGVTFWAEPVAEETEITGPVAAKLFVSSSTVDADLFLVLRAFDPDGREVVFQGAVDPHTPIAQGWLRASHRKLDQRLSTEYRPYHTHDEVQPLTPGEIYELDVEIWPTSIVLPAGHRIALTVRGGDYEYPELEEAAGLSHFKGTRMRGCGIYVHDDPEDRPDAVFGGTTTLHAGGEHPSSVLLPVVPSRE
jgi:putative CocE/NonD family hydrolase